MFDVTDTMTPPASATHAAAQRASGPLTGVRIVEFAGIGPGPFACMMLADMGAEVVTLDRVSARKNLKSVAGRGRKVVELDLKNKEAVAQAGWSDWDSAPKSCWRRIQNWSMAA